MQAAFEASAYNLLFVFYLRVCIMVMQAFVVGWEVLSDWGVHKFADFNVRINYWPRLGIRKVLVLDWN